MTTNTKPKVRHHKRIREGDKVVAIAGNERGRSGIVLSRTGDRAVVQGLNVRKKAVRRSEANPQGGFVELERPMHISNLSIADEQDKPVKLKARTNEDGSRDLVYQAEGNEVLYRPVKQKKQ